MRIAIPVWNGKVSPVLDTAGMLRIYDFIGGRPVLREELAVSAGEEDLAEFIAKRSDVIICGAISRHLELQMASLGIVVHPWIMGSIDYLIECYRKGTIKKCEFSMPGCGRNRHGRCSRRKNCGLK